MGFRSFIRATTLRQLLVAYVAAAVLVGVAGWTSWTTIKRASTAVEWRAHTLEVIGAIKELEQQLRTAETDQRGLLITGQRAYVDAYSRDIEHAMKAFAVVRRMTADNPSQVQRFVLRVKSLLARPSQTRRRE